MVKPLFYVVATLLWVATHASLSAQCLLLKGTVADEQSQQGLPGATVRLYNDATTGATTDADGKFELEVITKDSLLASFIGYQDKVVLLNSECNVTIVLAASQIALQEVTIQSERLIAEEFTIHKISKLDIYTNPSAKGDPLLAVNSTPSATTIDESANISLRGSSPAETGIFLNNVPINDAVRYTQLNGIGTFSIFNTALIRQVQVYPGNPPLEFGNTTSGLIALTTDEALPEKSTNTVSATLASAGLYTQRKLTRNSSLTAFSNYQPSYAIRWVNRKALEQLKDFRTIDLGLHYFIKIKDRTVFKVFNYSNIESYEYRIEQPTYNGIFYQDKIRNYSVTNLRHRLKNGELSWNSGLSFSKADFSMSTLRTTTRMNDFFSSINYQLFAEKYELKTGFSYDYRGSDQKGEYPRYDFAMGEQFPVDTFSVHQSVKLPEGYLYAKYIISSQWIIGTGLRKNIAMEGGNDFLSSQVTVNFRPASKWNVVLSAGRYNKFVLSQEGEFTSPHIQTDQYSLDMSYHDSPLEASLSLFYKRGRQSDKSTEIKGIEAYLQYRFNSHLRSQLSVTSLDAIETKQQLTTPSRYDIHYFIRGNVEYKINLWTITSVFLLRQGSFYNPVISATYHSIGAYEPVYDDPARLPSYHLIDLSGSRMMIWGDHFSSVIFAGISNIPNLKSVRSYSYNFDYSQKKENLFSLRTLYFGCVVNF